MQPVLSTTYCVVATHGAGGTHGRSVTGHPSYGGIWACNTDEAPIARKMTAVIRYDMSFVIVVKPYFLKTLVE